MHFYVNWFLKKIEKCKKLYFMKLHNLYVFYEITLKKCDFRKNGFSHFLLFSGTNLHKNTSNTIFERYICALFKNLSFIDLLVILVEL